MPESTKFFHLFSPHKDPLKQEVLLSLAKEMFKGVGMWLSG